MTDQLILGLIIVAATAICSVIGFLARTTISNLEKALSDETARWNNFAKRIEKEVAEKHAQNRESIHELQNTIHLIALRSVEVTTRFETTLALFGETNQRTSQLLGALTAKLDEVLTRVIRLEVHTGEQEQI